LTVVSPIEELPAGLVYVSDDMPGIRRRRRGEGFAYVDATGRALPARERLRCVGLGIPPAWENVWICADPAGHLQATGFDAAGRKQYRYHPAWSAWRAEAKYAGLAAFGRALARFRARVEKDLGGEAGDRTVSLAAIAVLLDRLHLRVGSAAHTARNRTFGATTLETRHLRLGEGEMHLRFRAKGGRMIEHTLRDQRLHRIFGAIHDLPGRNLFKWVDDAGEVHAIGSHDVNLYLAERAGLDAVTAKTFRTWAGTMAAFAVARAAPGRLAIRTMAEAAAERLHNTPAISRSAYIHPAVLGLAELDPDLRLRRLRELAPSGPLRLRADERRLIGLLETGGD
jgi:DNA topoisomerase-1